MAGASDNGGWSDNGSPDDLPDLPEEWGVIVIPDDLSELSDEVAAIRAELRLAEHPTPWRRLITRPSVRRFRRLALAAVRAPVLIISMAVLVTVASLVASAWPGSSRQPVAQRTSGTTGPDKVPNIELLGSDGQTVDLAATRPAVILVTDGCECAHLITDVIGATRAYKDVTVIVIGAADQNSPTQNSATPGSATPGRTNTPATQAAPPRAQVTQSGVVTLHAPPSNNVRQDLQVHAADGTAGVLLVDKAGMIVKRFPRTEMASDITPYLARI
jgi:hypothetical protein